MFCCARCTFVNPPNSEKCILCETPFFSRIGNISDWNCPLCSSLCLQSEEFCTVCGGIPLPLNNFNNSASEVIDLSSSEVADADSMDCMVIDDNSSDNLINTNNKNPVELNPIVTIPDHIKLKLCSRVEHYSQYKSIGSRWSCGYRNIQMLCSSLIQIPTYKDALFDGTGVMPDVFRLQQWIEQAWSAGYDVEVG